MIRLGVAVGYTRVLGLTPSHLLTLTIPLDAWTSLPQRARPLAYRKARSVFLHRFRQFLKRSRLPWAGLRWDEFMGNGTPHLHALFDLGGRLPNTIWEKVARAWVPVAWEKALKEAGFTLRKSPRTQFHALRFGAIGYAVDYASGGKKKKQKRFPFPGEWGRTWDLLGRWREEVRLARRADQHAPSVPVDPLSVLVLMEALQQLALGGSENAMRLVSRWLPLAQLVESVFGGEVDPGEVLRSYASGFWREGDREVLREALSMADLPIVVPPPPGVVRASRPRRVSHVRGWPRWSRPLWWWKWVPPPALDWEARAPPLLNWPFARPPPPSPLAPSAEIPPLTYGPKA